MVRRSVLWGRVLQCIMVLVPLLIIAIVVLQQSNTSLNADWRHSLPKVFHSSSKNTKMSKQSAGPCGAKRNCPADQFSFYIHSGAANVLPPAICVKDKLVLGTAINNAGIGLNVAVVNGKTGDVLKTTNFNTYSADVKPLIELLKNLEKGSVVMMASFDEPSSKLNEEVKKLIAELGSSVVNSLGYRDNWVFVGGKGTIVMSNFEKHLKNDPAKNKYDGWPELIEMEGCIPKYLD